MNKLTGDQQILGHFVRIRMILRWRRKAVKRSCIRKSPMPAKSAGAVHKPGNALARGTAGLHVCMQTVSSDHDPP
jgi:hypothetical protein